MPALISLRVSCVFVLGKNKMSKLNVRRDQQQNMERSLKMATGPERIRYDGPKEDVAAKIAGHLGYSSSSSSSTTSSIGDSLLSIENNVAIDQVSAGCAFDCCPNVGVNEAAKLFDCSSCFSVKYCGRECQLSDWK
jgi:hypothetical protein